jgi:hypothetical protein
MGLARSIFGRNNEPLLLGDFIHQLGQTSIRSTSPSPTVLASNDRPERFAFKALHVVIPMLKSPFDWRNRLERSSTLHAGVFNRQSKRGNGGYPQADRSPKSKGL